MGFGVSIFLITLGAILRFAVSTDLIGKAVNIHTVGVILMIVGGASFLLQLLMAGRTSAAADGRGHLYDGEDHQPPPHA